MAQEAWWENPGSRLKIKLNGGYFSPRTRDASGPFGLWDLHIFIGDRIGTYEERVTLVRAVTPFCERGSMSGIPSKVRWLVARSWDWSIQFR